MDRFPLKFVIFPSAIKTPLDKVDGESMRFWTADDIWTAEDMKSSQTIVGVVNGPAGWGN